MATLYFHDGGDVLVTELTPSADSHSEFAHTFGGDFQYSGKRYMDFDDVPRLIYRLDLNDPNVRTEIPGIKFLPLFYAFTFNGAPMHYRVVADDAIEIVDMLRPRLTPKFPYRDGNYPKAFPKMHAFTSGLVKATAHTTDTLKKEEWEKVKAEHGDDKNELVGVLGWLWQGPYKTKCPTPSCNKRVMDTFAKLKAEETPGLNFWGEPLTLGDRTFPPNPYVQISYEICQQCKLIHTGSHTT